MRTRERPHCVVLLALILAINGVFVSSKPARAAALATRLQDTPECSSDAAGNLQWTALFLGPAGSQPVGAPAHIGLASEQLRLELVGCERSMEAWICKGTPLLRFSGGEADSSDPIMAFYVVVDGRQADCRYSTCDVPLPLTDELGIEVAYRHTTVSGASSMPEFARVRVSAVEGSGGSGKPVWQVEVLSQRFRDDRMDRCGLAWDSLPPLVDRPPWLGVVGNPESLRTDETYVFLEERLTNFGFAKAGQVGDPDPFAASAPTGMAIDGAALVGGWQNRFDEAILDAASARGLPARLVKGLFAYESQFWPGSIPETGEVGLGHMSELGADNLLLWSPAFYARLCPKVLHPETCEAPYPTLPEEEKAMLRSALLASVSSDCADCPGFQDLEKAERTVDVFAESLVAYCSQTGRMVYNVTRETPGLISTYEDLWRFTLANYNAGSGCLAQALTKTWQERQPLEWTYVGSNLPGNCQRAIEYVSKVLGETAAEFGPDGEETSALIPSSKPETD